MKKFTNLLLFFTSAVFCLPGTYGQWTPQADTLFGPNTVIVQVDAVDQNVVWAAARVGYRSVRTTRPWVIRTADGGATWKHDSIPGTNGLLAGGLYAVDANTAWVSLNHTEDPDKRSLYRTVDGGKTWQLRLKSQAAGQTIHFFDAANGLLLRENIFSYTTDGGLTWSKTDSFPHGFANPYAFIPDGALFKTYGDTVWVVTQDARIARSADKGKTWRLLDTPLTKDSFQFIAVAFSNGHQGFAFANWDDQGEAIFMTTKDGGLSWSTLPAGSNPISEPYWWPELLEAAPGLSNIYLLRANFYAPDTYELLQETLLSIDGGKDWDNLSGPSAGGSYAFGKAALLSLEKGWLGQDIQFRNTASVIAAWNKPPQFTGEIVLEHQKGMPRPETQIAREMPDPKKSRQDDLRRRHRERLLLLQQQYRQSSSQHSDLPGREKARSLNGSQH